MKINARLDLNYSATQQAEWIKKKTKQNKTVFNEYFLYYSLHDV